MNERHWNILLYRIVIGVIALAAVVNAQYPAGMDGGLFSFNFQPLGNPMPYDERAEQQRNVVELYRLEQAMDRLAKEPISIEAVAPKPKSARNIATIDENTRLAIKELVAMLQIEQMNRRYGSLDQRPYKR